MIRAEGTIKIKELFKKCNNRDVQSEDYRIGVLDPEGPLSVSLFI